MCVLLLSNSSKFINVIISDKNLTKYLLLYCKGFQSRANKACGWCCQWYLVPLYHPFRVTLTGLKMGFLAKEILRRKLTSWMPPVFFFFFRSNLWLWGLKATYKSGHNTHERRAGITSVITLLCYIVLLSLLLASLLYSRGNQLSLPDAKEKCERHTNGLEDT